MILLDTDHLSLLQRGDPHGARLKRRLDALPAGEYGTTIISYEEQMRGWMAYIKSARTLVQQIDAYARLMTHLDEFRRIEVLPFDSRAAVEFQRIQKLHLGVGTMDLRIASIAFASGSTLLSRNLRDFRKIPDLAVEDWSV